MNSYKHSGAFGDLIYSMSVAKYLGPGKFYLHLDQINWIGQHYYGSAPNPYHKGRLNQQDFEFMREFMLAQPWITDFAVIDNSTEITHNLDRFRTSFVGHPGNYVDIYCRTMGIHDLDVIREIRTQPWLTVAQARRVKDRPIVINRTNRWLPPTLSSEWLTWRTQGWESLSVFVGLEQEYNEFIDVVGWDIPWQPVNSMLELAEYIWGSERFIGNQSMALSLAIGLGCDYCCEYRRDLPLERNECWFPNQPKSLYF